MAEDTGRDAKGYFTKGNKIGRGRNKGHIRLERVVQNILNEEITTKQGKLSKLEAIFQIQVVEALKGDLKAAVFLIERGWGKPKLDVVIEDPDTPKVKGFKFVVIEDPEEQDEADSEETN